MLLNEADVETEAWDDPVRGQIRFRTVFSGGLTPTHSLTMGLAELPVRGWLGRHRHGPVEVYYVEAGEGRVFLDGNEHDVSAGASVFIPSNAEHGITNTGNVPMRLLYTFAADSMAAVHYRFSEAAAPHFPSPSVSG